MTSNTYLTQNQRLYIYTRLTPRHGIKSRAAMHEPLSEGHASSRSEKRIGEQGELLCLRSGPVLMSCWYVSLQLAPMPRCRSVLLLTNQALPGGVSWKPAWSKFGRLSRSDRHETRCVYSRQVYKHGTEENGAKFSISFRAGSSAA